MIVFGGFINSKKYVDYSNAVSKYNFDLNQ